MKLISLSRHSLSAVVVAAACVAGAGSVHAATATVTLDSGLLSALGFLGASVSAGGTGVSYTGGAFAAPLASVSLATAGPGPVTVSWGSDASLTIANAQATAVFSGFAYDAATSEITADIAFSSATLTKTYTDTGFLIVQSPVGSIGGSADLKSVSASASPVSISFTGAGYFDMVALSPVVLELGVPSSLISSLGASQVATVAFSGTTAVTAPAAVPEVGTGLSFLAGLGLMGAVVRRRNRV